MNGIYVVIGVVATHRYLLPGILRRWVLLDVAPALVVAVLVVVAGTQLAALVGPSPLVRLAVATTCSVLATAILLLFVYRDARALAIEGCQAIVTRFGTFRR